MLRKCTAVNEGWKFGLDPENIGIKQGWQITGLEQNQNKTVKNVMLPHTFNVDSESEEYRGVYWYEYTFTVPDEWMNKQVWFDFHGIYRDAQFWVNGKSVGSHNGAGFTSFVMDIRNAEEDLGYKPQYTYLKYLEDYKKERELGRFNELWVSK